MGANPVVLPTSSWKNVLKRDDYFVCHGLFQKCTIHPINQAGRENCFQLFNLPGTLGLNSALCEYKTQYTG